MKTVIRLKSFAKKIGMSQRHVQRLIAAGEGPVLTELGKRIKGVTDDDGDAWLAARRKLPPGWVDLPVTDDRAVPVDEADADARTEAHQRMRVRTAQGQPSMLNGRASSADGPQRWRDPERHRVRAAKKKPAG
jgi:predicted DNA-binding transcriptional regulator AlpA